MSTDLQKVILITGTSSGFGLLAAARLSAQGHFVYATMRDVNRKQLLLDEVGKRGGQVLVRELDVTKPATIVKIIDEIKQHHGHIDAVVNNAGFGLGGFFEDLSEDEIRRQMEVNFFGVQNVCRQVLPLMRERKQGHIINISSIAGQTATPCLGAYNSSKWALEGFSESLYYEVRQFGIHVVLVEPGSYPTKIFRENACYGKNYHNPQSPYYHFSQRLQSFVEKHIRTSKKNPEDVAQLIERIICSNRPRLRYISDVSSTIRVMTSKVLPPSLYEFIFRKVIYGNSQHTV
jgi:NAD(P)-dependent dehydrogenase (short-subunit alcohol dehydrogenase family)